MITIKLKLINSETDQAEETWISLTNDGDNKYQIKKIETKCDFVYDKKIWRITEPKVSNFEGQDLGF